MKSSTAKGETGGESVKRCPILPNWMMQKDGKCKRYWLCDEERRKICKAKPKL